MNMGNTTSHKNGTREEWLAARLELLKAEKEHTRRGDELARQRRELPWVRIDKKYSTHTRGTEFLMSFYPILDRVPKGRAEDGPMGIWLHRHDEYGKPRSKGSCCP